MRSAAIVVLVACAHPVPRMADAPVEVPPDRLRHYTIWLGGSRVGTATEAESWSHAGVVLRRTESLSFLRGDAPVAITTTIEVAASPGLIPSRVSWTERSAITRTGEAHQDERGWTVTIDGRSHGLPAGSIPSELVPLLIRRDGMFTGSVFLPARGFINGHGRVEPVAPARLVARMALDAGPIVEATIDLEDDGTFARVVDGEGVIAMRATPAQVLVAFPPLDLVAATSVPLTGRRSQLIALTGDLALPAVPGQVAHPATSGLEVELSAALPGGLPAGPSGTDRSGEITALVASVRSRIAPDLGAGIASVRDAESATAGDCTTFALAYSALAQRLAIPTRVVTGLRIDGDRLVRHRWAVSWTGRAWIAVDAAFGAAPAGGDLIGLAIHDADDAGLIAGEAALTQVRAAAWL